MAIPHAEREEYSVRSTAGLELNSRVCYTLAGMSTRLSDWRVFLKEFVQNYHTTGAILPSGRSLATALARFVALPAEGPRKILEVGPGTGAVTRHIIAAMRPDDQLDLVELNPSFVAHLHNRFESDPAFRAVADRAQVRHCPVEELPDGATYHVIVSGLPLNNFSVDDVRRILATLERLLAAGATLSFFEYIALRRLKTLVSGRAERVRLGGIGRLMGGLLAEHEVRRDWVWPNVPPAWVHHLRFDQLAPT
jgi:phosphatidylethanolamine/phosphatidyl-N-methylethanolamine N-methyltransferase